MTNQEIRIAIAEECGWKSIVESPLNPTGYIKDSIQIRQSLTKLSYDWSHSDELGAMLLSEIPNYPESLDACAEFEKTLTKSESIKYREILEQLCGYDFYKATTLQRCEAFLRVKGKWKD